MNSDIYKQIQECLKENSNLSPDTKLRLFNTVLSNSNGMITGQEQVLVNYLCNMEARDTIRSIGENKKREIKEVLGIKSPESETNFFIKLFIRDFVSNIIKDERLKLKDNLTAGKLFEDFASSELKSNKEFCKSVLKIDGRYMPFMESNIRNSKEFMKKAIENDTSSEIDSFTKSDTKLKSDPSLATLYFQKRKENNGYRFKIIDIYKDIFELEDGNYPTTIFKNSEQKEWLKNSDFLVNLVKLYFQFVNYIVYGKIPMNQVEAEQKSIAKVNKK